MAVRLAPAKRGLVQAQASAAADAPIVESSSMVKFKQFSELFSNLFPVWTVISAAVALKNPAVFSFMTTESFTGWLALLMFSMGITMTLDDFKRVLGQPVPVMMNFLACYAMMPALAYFIARALNLPPPFLAGCVLVGSINGGQASNLCTYIAKGDVALSVIMTTATTVGTIFMTPLIAKMVLGTVVSVDAIGIVKSTLQVVMAPIILGMMFNTMAPKVCRAVEPACPVVGVIATVVLVGSSVAQCAGPILAAGWSLQIALVLLHLIGGLVGYFMIKAIGLSDIIARTTAIETAMKSSAFGFLLASLHFPEYLVRVPAAVSVVWMAVTGSTLAVIWRFIPMDDAKPKEIVTKE